jgi:hypothetical protein
LPKGEQVHAKAIYCLQDCGIRYAGDAANDLDALRRQRNRADYELDGNAYKRPLAETQLEKAKQILEALQECRSGPDAIDFRDKVRAQAKILGLPVSSEQ